MELTRDVSKLTAGQERTAARSWAGASPLALLRCSVPCRHQEAIHAEHEATQAAQAKARELEVELQWATSTANIAEQDRDSAKAAWELAQKEAEQSRSEAARERAKKQQAQADAETARHEAEMGALVKKQCAEETERRKAVEAQLQLEQTSAQAETARLSGAVQALEAQGDSLRGELHQAKLQQANAPRP